MIRLIDLADTKYWTIFYSHHFDIFVSHCDLFGNRRDNSITQNSCMMTKVALSSRRTKEQYTFQPCNVVKYYMTWMPSVNTNHIYYSFQLTHNEHNSVTSNRQLSPKGNANWQYLFQCKVGLHHLPEVTNLTLWRHYDNMGSRQRRSRFDIALL